MTSPAVGKVDAARLWQRHMDLARFGATPKGGVNRQALSEPEFAARRQLVAWATALGFEVFVDGITNLFIRLPGRDPDAAPVLTGSHIDSQPTGGKFDGTYGVLAGLEALQAIREAGIVPDRPIEVVAWLNEEGSRFAPGMMGSEAFADLRDLDAIMDVRDRDGALVRDLVPQAIAATPEAAPRAIGFPVHAFVEAHIEQGPLLERAGLPVGVVTGIQGVRRMRVKVTGEEAHAGTTPHAARRDALAEASAMIAALHEALYVDDDTRFTVGLIQVSPNVPSVVASEVTFSLDIRHPDSALLADLERKVAPVCRAAARACSVEAWTIAEASSIHFSADVIDTIEASARDLAIPSMRLFSGAGHDARQLHFVCPTGMIFVPCEKGISHNEAENATAEDLAAGTRVLVETLLRLAAA